MAHYAGGGGLERDDLTDLIMLDHEGYLAYFRRERRNDREVLVPPRPYFETQKSGYVRLNTRTAGGSGRRKLCVVDWDGDGALDVLANSPNAELWKNAGSREGMTRLVNKEHSSSAIFLATPPVLP